VWGEIYTLGKCLGREQEHTTCSLVFEYNYRKWGHPVETLQYKTADGHPDGRRTCLALYVNLYPPAHFALPKDVAVSELNSNLMRLALPLPDDRVLIPPPMKLPPPPSPPLKFPEWLSVPQDPDVVKSEVKII
jgi:hypothetical protein